MAIRGRSTKPRREPSFSGESGTDGAQGEGLRADPDERARVSREPPRARREKKPKAKRRSSGLARKAAGFVFKWGLVAGIWGAIAGVAVLAAFWFTLPPIEAINKFERRPSLVFVDGGGETVATYGDLYGGLVKLDEMPPWLPMAVLATEDRRFYTHFGIDPQGLARAMLTNLRAGRVVQGGSTITQQLAKNVFLSSDRSFKRKIQEMLLAFRLEHAYSKDEILTIYLNRVYLGAGTYGVEAAARRYFGKSAREVNAHEAAVIAGLLKAPSKYAPTASIERARARAGDVLDNMVEAGFMTAAQRAAAAKLPLATAGATVAQRGNRYFTDWLAEQVQGFVGYQTQDLTVVTTMNPRLQRTAEAALEDILAREGKKADVEQGAFVLMRPDGAVEAMVGGRDYGKSAFNRAVDARRQPGSAFKAFVYLAAAEQGLRPDESVGDGPIQIQNWRPRNFDNKVYGEISVRDAFARSVNTSAVRVAQRAGVDAIVREARALGIASPIPRNLSIALGTADVSLLELTGAYAAFANGGNGVLPYAITEIRDPAGHVLYRRQGSGPGQVISPHALATMQDLLQAVVRQGTGRGAAIDRPMGGKTGTTNDYRDAWFVGFTADYVAGAWFGNDDATEMERTTGGSLPARLWKAVMLEASKDLPARPLPGTQSPEEQGWFSRLLTSLQAPGGSQVPQAPARAQPAASNSYDFANDPILRANQNR
ncbi:MAG: PBP1A family penicillin-binding protein [Alphaproteobacteria bacterium]|nr:PBP1A family penicillin-binding protein [Alphaproteobacteria bacterium]